MINEFYMLNARKLKAKVGRICPPVELFVTDPK